MQLAKDEKTHDLILTDLELAKACELGDVQARNVLVKRLMGMVRALTRYLSSGDSESDDYAQLALIEILNSIGKFRGEGTIESWARRVVVRSTIRQIKMKRKQRKIVLLDPEAEQKVHLLVRDNTEKNTIARHIAIVLGKLKPKYRIAITLKLVLGYTVDEISDLTDVNAYAVRHRLREGRKKLHRLISCDPALLEIIGEWKS